MAEMISSDSMNEIIEASRATRLAREKSEQATIEATGEQQRQTIEAQKQAENEAWEKRGALLKIKIELLESKKSL